MAKLRHIAMQVPDPDKAGGGFYEVTYRDPNGVVVDITENGWGGAAKAVVAVTMSAADTIGE